MIEGTIAQRWARALLELAREEERVDAVREQLNALASLLTKEKALKAALESPSFHQSEKIAIVRELAAAMNLLPAVKNFLSLAMTKSRARYLLPIVEHFNRAADELTGVVKAELTSAVELSPEMREQMRVALEKTTGKKIELQAAVDPSLLGGATIRLGSRVVDGSLRSQLAGLARQLARVE